MIPRIIGLVLVVCSFQTFAQSDIDSMAADPAREAVDSVAAPIKFLIIPFEERLFFCDIMRDLTATNNLDIHQIFGRFSDAVQLSLAAAFSDSIANSEIVITDSIEAQELTSVYSQLGYEYAPIPQKTEDDKGKKTKKKKSPAAEHRKQAGIRNGQVIAERDDMPRYMNAKLKDSTVLLNLFDHHGINRFLFINQLDVKIDLSDPETAFLEPKRVVAFHYTVLDSAGRQICGSLAMRKFEGNESNIGRIISDNFYKLAVDVVQSFRMGTENEKEKKDKKRNVRSKLR